MADFFTHQSKKRFKTAQDQYSAFCVALDALKKNSEYQPLTIGALCFQELTRLCGGSALGGEVEKDIQAGVSEFIERYVYQYPDPILFNNPSERMKISAFIESHKIFVENKDAIPSLAGYFSQLFYENFFEGSAFTGATGKPGTPRIYLSVEDSIKDIQSKIRGFHSALTRTQVKNGVGSLFVENPAVIGTDNYLNIVESLPPSKALSEFCNLPHRCFSFLDSKMLLELPDKDRNEHMWICAGSGHGKTQLLQNMIYNDLIRAKKEGIGLCVMDGQGDLIENILETKALADVKDRVVLIDPQDTQFPIALNPLKLMGDVTGLSEADRLASLQFSLDLFNYIFASILSRRLTGKQETMLSFCVMLLLDVPGANLNTFRDLLKDHTPFSDHIDNSEPAVRDFFLFEFDKKSNQQTRDQISERLYAINKNTILSRMLFADENNVDFFEGMRDGKIFLISTDTAIMGMFHGLFGRIFISLILLSSYRVKSIPKDQRKYFFVYADEAQDYLDHNTEKLLDQVRKFKVGMVYAHQRLEQLSDGVLSAFQGCTSIQAFAKLGIKDERRAAEALRVHPDLIFSLRSEDYVGAEYVIKTSKLKQGVKAFVPFGIMENSAKAPANTRNEILKNTRAKYSTKASPKKPKAPASQAKTLPPSQNFKPAKKPKI